MEIAFQGLVAGDIREFQGPGEAMAVVLGGGMTGEGQEKQGGNDAYVVGLCPKATESPSNHTIRRMNKS